MTMKKTKEELTSLFNMYYEIETTEEKLAFARENLFLDKKALSKSFNLITNKEEKLDFIDEYIENSTLNLRLIRKTQIKKQVLKMNL